MADATQLRFASLLRRAFAIKAADPGRVVSPIIQPGFDVADPYHPEDRLSRGERLFSTMVSVSNVAATNFGALGLANPPGSGRIAVIKRVTWDAALPTAANQPGNVFAFIGLFTSPPGAIAVVSRVKDGRNVVAGTLTPAVGHNIGAAGVQTPSGNCLYAVRFLPGAAIQLVVHQVDNLDIIVAPNQQAQFLFASDVLPVATWSWDCTIEGYERIADPVELITPPP